MQPTSCNTDEETQLLPPPLRLRRNISDPLHSSIPLTCTSEEKQVEVPWASASLSQTGHDEERKDCLERECQSHRCTACVAVLLIIAVVVVLFIICVLAVEEGLRCKEHGDCPSHMRHQPGSGPPAGPVPHQGSFLQLVSRVPFVATVASGEPLFNYRLVPESQGTAFLMKQY